MKCENLWKISYGWQIILWIFLLRRYPFKNIILCMLYLPKPSNPKAGLLDQPQWELASFLFTLVTLSRHSTEIDLPCFHLPQQWGRGAAHSLEISATLLQLFYDNIMITLWLQTLYRSFKHTDRFVITRRSWSYHKRDNLIIFLKK